MKSIRKILKAHYSLAKMFYRRDGSTEIISASGEIMNFDGKSDLYKESFDIISKELDEKTPEEVAEGLITKLSGKYGKRLVQWTVWLNNPEVQDILAIVRREKAKKVVIIYTTTQTNPSKTLVEQACKATGIQIESFSVDNLIFDVVEHRLVFPHRWVKDPEERKAILDGFSIDENSTYKLASISTEDAVCKYYAFPEGALIEIMRPRPSGVMPYYRIVVNMKTKFENETMTLETHKDPVVVPPSERKYTKYMSPSEYAMIINKTANQITKSSAPPQQYLDQPERRLLQISKQMVDDKNSDVVVVRPHINSNKVEHWHLTELVPPKVS